MKANLKLMIDDFPPNELVTDATPPDPPPM